MIYDDMIPVRIVIEADVMPEYLAAMFDAVRNATPVDGGLTISIGKRATR